MSRITQITVSGFKSLLNETSIETRPLTILAGANGAGKSSIMQPLLLLKQTLEATYDPGALLIDGPNVSFTSAKQFLARQANQESVNNILVGLKADRDRSFISQFVRKQDRNMELAQTEYYIGNAGFKLIPTMTNVDIENAIAESYYHEYFESLRAAMAGPSQPRKTEWVIQQQRCFLSLALSVEIGSHGTANFFPIEPLGFSFDQIIQKVIHVPALRGNPSRTYKTTAVGPEFVGTFEPYTASIINYWQLRNDKRLRALERALAKLALTWTVEAEQLDDVQIELRVGRQLRRTKNGGGDTVNIADVGFGVSQVLPVLVSLLAAERHQLVYLEQPEIHLHPRAQVGLAEILIDAAKRGVQVVIETHSALLIRTIQSLVAEGKFPPENVMLHWFTRQKNGITKIDSTELDKTGAFGNWPEDFAATELDVEGRYLDAVLIGK